MELLIGALIVFAGGLMQGCTGFGFAMICAPVLLLFLPQEIVTPVIICLSMVNNIVILVDTRKYVRFRMLGWLYIGGIIGLPVGAYFLTNLDPVFFKVGVGAVVMILSIVMLSGWKRQMKASSPGLIPVGFISGLLAGSISTGGPPVVLFLSNQGVDKNSFRANLVAYFTVINMGAIVVFIMYGLMTTEVLTKAGLFVIPVFIGTSLGCRLVRRINDKLFRKAVLGFLIILSIILVGTSLSG